MYRKLWQAIAEKQWRPVYLFWGSEQYLISESLARLEAAIAPAGDASFNLEKLDARECTAHQVVLSAGTTSFFSTQKLVVVQRAPWFSLSKKGAENEGERGKAESSIILDYLAHPVPETCLVFVVGPEEKISKTLKTTKALAKVGEIIEFAPMQGEALQIWLKQAFQAKGQKLQSAAGSELVARSGNDLTLLAGEVEKISTYADGRDTVTVADVQAVGSTNVQTTIFNFIDAVAQSNVLKSRYFLEDILLKEGPYGIIPLLAGHFRFMLLVLDMRSHGYGNTEIMKETGRNSSWFIDKSYRQGQTFGADAIKKVLQILLQADYKAKRGITNMESALDLAILQICALK